MIRPENTSAITISAPYILAYDAQPCAQDRYQPRPDFTPIISAATSTENDAPSPMNRPTKTCGNAAGMATRSTRNHSLAPMVRATS